MRIHHTTFSPPNQMVLLYCRCACRGPIKFAVLCSRCGKCELLARMGSCRCSDTVKTDSTGFFFKQKETKFLGAAPVLEKTTQVGLKTTCGESRGPVLRQQAEQQDTLATISQSQARTGTQSTRCSSEHSLVF